MQLHGHGTSVYASGNVYEGQWREGRKHGRGRFVHAEGDIQDGEWENGLMHGRTPDEELGPHGLAAPRVCCSRVVGPARIGAGGKQVNADGSSYEGEVRRSAAPIPD